MQAFQSSKNNLLTYLLKMGKLAQFQIELFQFHDQLPLAVPCYDLLPVTELTLGPHLWRDFGYSRLP
jgi:hypothetical protein